MTVVVGLAWHSLNPGNLGIDALSRTDISIIDAAAENAGVKVEYILMGNPSRKHIKLSDKRISIGPRPSLKRYFTGRDKYAAAVRKCDLVIDIGEGDSFADIYGFKRFGVQLLSKLIAMHAGKPLILAPQTIGPFKNPVWRTIAKIIMRRCERIYSRDHLSTQVLRDLGVAGNSDEAIDLAFSLPFNKKEGGEDSPKRVGINVSGLLLAGGYNSSNQFGLSIDYEAFTRGIIEYFLKQDGVEVWLVPHVLSSGSIEDDTSASNYFRNIYPDVKIAPDFEDSTDAKSFISGLDFLCAGRMHACIAAFSSKVAVVPVAYSRKFAGLFGTLGYDHVLDARELTTEQAVDFVSNAFVRREQLVSNIEKGLEIVEARLKLYRDFLSEILLRIDRAK